MELFKGLPVLLFASQADWHTWLEANHRQPQGVWLKHAKKSSGKESVSYQEALEVSLCYGWIDSLARRLDDEKTMQKFTPRKPNSVWSKLNKQRVKKLIEQTLKIENRVSNH